jgi:hypothetical protein
LTNGVEEKDVLLSKIEEMVDLDEYILPNKDQN